MYMKAAIISGAVLIVIAAAMLGVRAWDSGTVEASADYQPAPAFTPEDQSFARQAHALIQSAINLDRNAVRKSRTNRVRDFASGRIPEERQMIDALKKTIAAISHDFTFKYVETVETRTSSSKATFDRDYLESIVRVDEKLRSVLENSSIRNAELADFAGAWRTPVETRLNKARSRFITIQQENQPCRCN
jgi:predicted outer membrane protein